MDNTNSLKMSNRNSVFHLHPFIRSRERERERVEEVENNCVNIHQCITTKAVLNAGKLFLFFL